MRPQRHLTDSFEIGKLLKEQLNPLLPVYPIIADREVPMPFSIYRRTGFSVGSTKDSADGEDTVSMEVFITSSNYPESVDLAMKIKDRLEKLRGRWRDLVINGVTLTQADEDWHNDAYIQRLYFNIHISKI